MASSPENLLSAVLVTPQIYLPSVQTIIQHIPLGKPDPPIDESEITVVYTATQKAVEVSSQYDCSRLIGERSKPSQRKAGERGPYSRKEMTVIAREIGLTVPPGTSKNVLADMIRARIGCA